MKPPNPAVQALTRRLLTHEAGERRDVPAVVSDTTSGVSDTPEVEALADAAERACDKLRLSLAKLLGSDGLGVLVGRALTLARAEFPFLEGVQVRSDGSLKGLAAAAAALLPRAGGSDAVVSPSRSRDLGRIGHHPGRIGYARDTITDAEAVEGIIAVLAHFLGLLETFIGQDLTLRLLKGVWPEAGYLIHVEAEPDVDSRAALRGEETGGD